MDFPQHRVLIIDDERVIADTFAIIFQRAGYLAEVAYSAEAALEAASTRSPQVAIVDVFLLGMTGIEFARWLKKRCPDCHIILLSGQPATGTLLEAEEDGHTWTVLPKPVPPGQILRLCADFSIKDPVAASRGST